MDQMCSGVDLFGLICDLGTGGSGQWRLAYPDLSNRQSMWSFLYSNSKETRVAPDPIGLPYILHTFDNAPSNARSHIVCLRTKVDANASAPGAKLAFYSDWNSCTTYPNANAPDCEFYDYTNNTSEMGNDYYSSNSSTQNRIAQYRQVMGIFGPQSTGLMATELNRPLVGTGLDGAPLSQSQAAAKQAYYTYTGSNSCGTG